MTSCELFGRSVFFGYTNCPDVCSTIMGDIAAALAETPPAVRENTMVVFVTTDPERAPPRSGLRRSGRTSPACPEIWRRSRRPP
ncbi:SCO family protein [Streptomyces sp. NPDC001876]|uniref:SCO family protein n=1 Tax=Streptomyces sp. NPDC001876 TaxID=3154402 RepID=UPI0033331C9F